MRSAQRITAGLGSAMLAVAALVSGAGGALFGPLASAGAAGTESATVTLSQGIDLDGSGTTAVDVVLDGRICALRNVAYGTIARRLTVPAGIHTLTVLVANGRCTSGLPLAATTIDASAGGDFSVAARTDADGTPSLGLTQIDLSPLDLYRVRVTVHNQTTAALLDATITRAAHNPNPRIDVVDLPAGTSSAGDEIWVGYYDLTVDTGQTTAQVPLTLISGRVIDIYVTGRPEAPRVQVNTRLAEGATP